MSPGVIEVTEPLGGLIHKQQFQAAAYYIGERIDVRSVVAGSRVAPRPLTVVLEAGAVCVLFRWGAVAFFDAGRPQIEKFLGEIRPFVEQPYVQMETETIAVRVDDQAQNAYQFIPVSQTRQDRRRLASKRLSVYANAPVELFFTRPRVTLGKPAIQNGYQFTEAACKTVFTQRLKLSGMRWSKAGAQVILNLRVILLSGVWDDVYQAVVTSYNDALPRTLGPSIPNRTRKAA